MKTIGVFFGSATGNTRDAAVKIKAALGDEGVTVANIGKATAADLNRFDVLILGTSTWGSGDWQDDWAAFRRQIDQVNWSGKCVALFGLGDQYGYADTFVDAMGLLYEAVVAQGAKVIGAWPDLDYEFEASCAHRDGGFVGLALDADNQPDLTETRIRQWVRIVKGELPS
ncbi:MAG TPA: flavodoxin [Sedimentisphaerales bacterium]|nr:flavodoxin [Sedimentisphaerales bacterium]HNU31067.1 flavodoxin [Sedimentisphaerales bacterium]